MTGAGVQRPGFGRPSRRRSAHRATLAAWVGIACLHLACLHLAGCADPAPTPAVPLPAPGTPAPPIAPRAFDPAPAVGAGSAPAITALPDPASLPVQGSGLENGDFAPELAREDLRGGPPFVLSRLVGPQAAPEGPTQAVIVGMVASWCGPCAASLPTLKALEAEHGDLLNVVLVATDLTREGRQKEADKVAAAGLRAVVLDPSEVDLAAWMGTRRNVPHFYVINRAGEVLVQDRGFGNKVRAVLPKQVAFALRNPQYVARKSGGGSPAAAPAAESQEGPDGG